MSATTKRRQLAHLRREAAELSEQIQQIEQMPEDEFFDEGDVVWYTRRFDALAQRTYVYTAFKMGPNRWWLSGRSDGFATRGPVTWDDLLELFVSGDVEELWFATEWQKVDLP